MVRVGLLTEHVTGVMLMLTENVVELRLFLKLFWVVDLVSNLHVVGVRLMLVVRVMGVELVLTVHVVKVELKLTGHLVAVDVVFP